MSYEFLNNKGIKILITMGGLEISSEDNLAKIYFNLFIFSKISQHVSEISKILMKNKKLKLFKNLKILSKSKTYQI